MSTVRHGAVLRVGALITLFAMLALLASHVQSAGDRADGRRLTAVDARRAGVAVELTPTQPGGQSLLEVRLPSEAGEAAAEAGRRLLAVRPDGAAVAVADRIAADHATLTLAHADGSQMQVGVPGLIAAAYAPDGSWLAIVDGHGALSRVEAESGELADIADGPFLGPLTVLPAGDILALRVASVEAPFTSSLVRVDPADGTLTAVSDESLVYAAALLDDGSFAVVAHRPEGTQLRRVDARGRDVLVADLGPGAVNVAVAATGSHVAWERYADGVHVLDIGTGDSVRLAGATRPRFAPDGAALLVQAEGRSLLVDLDGRSLALIDSPAAAFVPCPEGCRP